MKIERGKRIVYVDVNKNQMNAENPKSLLDAVRLTDESDSFRLGEEKKKEDGGRKEQYKIHTKKRKPKKPKH